MNFNDIFGYFKRRKETPIQKIEVVDKTVSIAQIQRSRVDISKWRSALESAENVYYPDRRDLIEIFEELILDPYISEAMKKRVRRVRNTPAMVLDKNGERDLEKTKLLQSVWFQDFVEGVVNSEFWGFSLLELKIEKGKVMECVLIPRNLVFPEFGTIATYTATGDDAIDFYQKPYFNYLVFAGKKNDLGLLNKLAPYAIYKRATLVNWSDHSEVFGMPIRIYEYDPQQPKGKQEAEEAAKSIGSLAYIVVPKGTGLTLEGGDGTAKPEMYETFRKALNSEMVIAILGQTMTTEQGSSRSQGEVHERTEADILADDLYRVQLFTSNNLVPRLAYFGILSEGDTIVFDKTEKLTIAQQLDMDLKLCEVLDVPMSYLYEKYNIPLPSKSEPVAKKQGKLGIDASLQDLGLAIGMSIKDVDGISKVVSLNDSPFNFDRFFEKYAGDFLKALEVGLEADISPELLSSMRQNAVEFAYAKTYAIEQAYKQGVANGLAKFLEIGSYTQTEKDLFTNSRQMAYKWEQIQKNRETLPLLQFDALNDSRVRPSHLALDGVTRPIDDDFWRTHYPPMGYNCRCTIRQMANGETTTDNDLQDRVQKEGGQPDKGFGYNVGIEKVAFKTDMSYFADMPQTELEKANKRAKEYLAK